MNTAQGGVCFVCHQLPKSGRLHIDHEHVKKWKKLPPDQRKRYVRGLLCFRCNVSFVGRGVTVERARNVVSYLENYTDRLSGASPTEMSGSPAGPRDPNPLGDSTAAGALGPHVSPTGLPPA